jgi:2-methylcitrate dehydratase PrpD
MRTRQERLGEPLRMWQPPFLGNVLEMDDVHRSALLHPGPVVWSSAFMFRFVEPDLRVLLNAAARGYEAMIAVGSTFDAYHYAHWHPTATAGVFGSAATCAAAADLNETETAWALANAGSVSGGLWHLRHDDVDTKQWHVHHAMRTGVDATWAAIDQISGPLSILEGPQGLYAATCRNPKPMVLGPGWRIEEVSFKPWAACRHAHPAIDCALELRAAGKLTAPFHVETYADALTSRPKRLRRSPPCAHK